VRFLLIAEKCHALKCIRGMALCLVLQLQIYLRFFFITPEPTTIAPPVPVMQAASAAAT
jgi:hypothetical protein